MLNIGPNIFFQAIYNGGILPLLTLWILATGRWNDSGQWQDNASWID